MFRFSDETKSGGKSRNKMVVSPSRSFQRESHSVPKSRNGYRNRCLQRGLGAHYNGMSIGGHWSMAEKALFLFLHINALELKARIFAVKAFAKQNQNINVLLKDGESKCSGLCQSNGRHKVRNLDRSSKRNVGMGPSTKHTHNGHSHTRDDQSQGRLCLERLGRSKRLVSKKRPV